MLLVLALAFLGGYTWAATWAARRGRPVLALLVAGATLLLLTVGAAVAAEVYSARTGSLVVVTLLLFGPAVLLPCVQLMTIRSTTVPPSRILLATLFGLAVGYMLVVYGYGVR